VSETLIDGRLTTVIVARTAFEAASNPEKADQLTAAIVSFVNDVQQAGVYARHELPAKALQVFHADYYLAEVNNGGHSQFIHNCDALLKFVIADARAALQEMGAHAQHQILCEMAAWVAANTTEAAAQDGFDTRAEALDELDRRFYDAEGETPISSLAAQWIAGWPELRIVADEEYAAAIDAIRALNPFLSARLIWRNTRDLRYQLTDSLQLGIAAACGAVGPDPEIKTAVRAGAYLSIEGQQHLAFGVTTDKGARLCVCDDAGARLYEFAKPTPAADESPKPLNSLVAGARLSRVSVETIAAFAKMAAETRAAEAVDLLLRTANFDPKAMLTAWKLHADGATWIVLTGERRVVVTTFDRGADLSTGDGTPVLKITRAAIDRHVAEVAKVDASFRAA
jgi:hypothetical protein